MKRQIVGFVLAAGLFISLVPVAMAGTISCPNLPKGTYSYNQHIKGWVLWLGQSGNLTLDQDFVWPSSSGNYKGMGYFYSLSQDGATPTCFFTNANGSEHFSLTSIDIENAKCSLPVGIDGNSCKTNSFIVSD